MQKLAKKMKMLQEGVRRQAMYKMGKHVDIIEYGVLKDEFYKS
jgi:RimJ/RimL family protein N-acetyltransferase